MHNTTIKQQPTTRPFSNSSFFPTAEPPSRRAIEAVPQQQPITQAFCDVCDQSASGTRAALEAGGWGFYQGVDFCPYHDDMI